MEEAMPQVYGELARSRSTRLETPLSRHAGHRVHRGAAASCGCCRPGTGKRTAKAALRKVAVDIVRTRALITREDEAIQPRRARRRSTSCCTRRIDPVGQARRASPSRPARLAGRGVGGEIGVRRGRRRSGWAADGKRGDPDPRRKPRPEDIHGMHAAQGYPHLREVG